jgi:hypothetical protein
LHRRLSFTPLVFSGIILLFLNVVVVLLPVLVLYLLDCLQAWSLRGNSRLQLSVLGGVRVD